MLEEGSFLTLCWFPRKLTSSICACDPDSAAQYELSWLSPQCTHVTALTYPFTPPNLSSFRLFAAICAVSAVKVSISMTPAVFLGAVLSPMPCLVLQASSSRSWKISVAVNADKAPPAAAFNSCPIMGTQPKHEDLGLMPLGYLMMWARSK